MSDVGNAGDRWIWRASTPTAKPRPPPPSSSKVIVAAQLTVTSSTTRHSINQTVMPSVFSGLSAAHPGATLAWGPGSASVTSPPSWLLAGLALTDTGMLQDLTSPPSRLLALSSHAAPWATTVAQRYITGMEAYDMQLVPNKPVIAGQSQSEGLHPSSLLVLSILVASLLVSLAANSVMVLAILRRCYLRQTVFVLHLNLAASDLLASLLSIPVAIIVISRGVGDGEERRGVSGGGGGGSPSMGACLLLNAGMVLMNYVSVGSIVGICTVRWCQFHSLSKTRARERVAVRLFILLLWATGAGIAASLVIRQAVETVTTTDVTCTVFHLTTVLNNTLPLSAIFISLGLVLVTLVNHLTIRRLSNTEVCPHPAPDTPSITYRYLARLTHTHAAHSLHNSATSEQSSLNGYPKTFSDDLIDRTLQGQCFSLNENKNMCTEAKISLPFAQGESNVVVASSGADYEGNKTQMSRDFSTDFLDQSSSVSLPRPPRSPPPPVTPPLFPLPSEADGLCQEEEKLPRGVRQVNLGSTDITAETELESEHLYEDIEPFDVQEIISSIEGNSRKQQVPRVLLPNVVEGTYNSGPSVKRIQTILADTTSALQGAADRTVSKAAWRMQDALPLHTDCQVNTEPVDPLPVRSSVKGEKFPDVMNEACLAAKVHTSSLHSSSSVREIPLSPRSWLPILSATQYNARLSGKPHSHAQRLHHRNCNRLAGVDDSPSAGYLADLSAPSSTPHTPHEPHHKLGRRQRAERIMALARARAMLNQSSLNDSDDEEPNTPRSPSLAAPVRGRSYRHKLSPPASQGKLSDPLSGNKMNSVHLKCIRTSHCLSALFILTYLPFLLVHVFLSVIGGPAVLLVTVTYMSCLLAVQPCLYGYQTPLLRHAMCNVGKRPRTSSHLHEGNA
uniref:G-protein coupled receptors family 1 profile domain-containing protein n=1 Tax=Scylla olivacea TaxID=85551 RepID=A0A0P4W6H7_SCYOL